MPKRKKTWAEKLAASTEFEVKPVPRDMAGMKAGQVMLIPTGMMVDAAVRTIPEGTSLTPQQLRAQLAAQHDAEVTCPITTGIFLRLAAEAAHEAFEEGTPLEAVTPVWRVLDAKAPALKKLSYDPAFILDQRIREGLTP